MIDLDLHHGTENSLVKKLEGGKSKLEDGKPNTAIKKIDAFINQVEAQSGKKIEAGDANDCIDKAQKIIDLIESA